MNTWWTWLHPSCLLTSETLIDLNEMSMLTHHLIILAAWQVAATRIWKERTSSGSKLNHYTKWICY
jgi:hypothetical protein